MRATVAVIVAALALTGCARQASPDVAADGGGPGTLIAGGFRVAPGSQLVLPAVTIPDAAGRPSGNWRVVLRLTGTRLRPVAEAYAQQARQLGYRVPSVDCWDAQGRGSGSPQAEEVGFSEKGLELCRAEAIAYASPTATAGKSVEILVRRSATDAGDGVLLRAGST